MSLIKEIYSNYSRFSSNVNVNIEQNNKYFDLELKKINKIKEKKIIEIGYGRGFFLDWAKKEKLDIIGYEINKEFHNNAKNKHNVKLGDGKNIFANISKKFDLIVLFDVVEHIEKNELLDFFNNLSKLLNKNGEILLRFPNGSSPTGLEFFNSDLTHVTFLNKRSIEMIAKMTKFELTYFDNMERVKFFRSIKGKLFGRFMYFFRDLLELFYGQLYFGERIPLDPNVIAILKKNN